MRHLNQGRRFGRSSEHRQAMFRNMCCSIIKHGLIKTTLPKAKEVRMYIEPLITLAKTDSVANRRLAFSKLANKEAVKALFETLGPRYAERPGGYVRVIKAGYRAGDSAPVGYVQLVGTEADAVATADVKEGEVV